LICRRFTGAFINALMRLWRPL